MPTSRSSTASASDSSPSRRRTPKLVAELLAEPAGAWRQITLASIGRINRKPRILDRRITLKHYPGEIRQITITDLGHEKRTLLITNQMDATASILVGRYALRMVIENTIADAIDFFHMDALSAAVPRKVQFDLQVTLMASTLYRILARRLGNGMEYARSDPLPNSAATSVSSRLAAFSPVSTGGSMPGRGRQGCGSSRCRFWRSATSLAALAGGCWNCPTVLTAIRRAKVPHGSRGRSAREFPTRGARPRGEIAEDRAMLEQVPRASTRDQHIPVLRMEIDNEVRVWRHRDLAGLLIDCPLLGKARQAVAQVLARAMECGGLHDPVVPVEINDSLLPGNRCLHTGSLHGRGTVCTVAVIDPAGHFLRAIRGHAVRWRSVDDVLTHYPRNRPDRSREQAAQPGAGRHYDQVRFDWLAVKQRAFRRVGVDTAAPDAAAFLSESFGSLHDGALGHDETCLRLEYSVFHAGGLELRESQPDLVHIQAQVGHTEPFEHGKRGILPSGLVPSGKDQRAAFDKERCAKLLLQFHPAEAGVPRPARVELVAAVDGAEDSRVVGRACPAVADFPTVHQRYPASPAEKAQCGHHTGNASSGNYGLRPVAHAPILPKK